MSARPVAFAMAVAGLPVCLAGCPDPGAHLKPEHHVAQFRAHQPAFRAPADGIASGDVRPTRTSAGDQSGGAEQWYAELPGELRGAGVYNVRYLVKAKVVLFEMVSHPTDSTHAIGICFDTARPDPVQAVRGEWPRRPTHRGGGLGDGWFFIT